MNDKKRKKASALRSHYFLCDPDLSDVGRGISHVSVFGGPWFFGIMIRRGEILISRVIYAIIIIHNFASVGQHLGGSKRGIVHVTGHTSLSANCRFSMHTTNGIVNCHVG